jgi:hypothetical protein
MLDVGQETDVEGRTRIGVTDGSSEPPRRLDLGPEATSGRGMYLLEELAEEWGIDERPNGKTVWFELEP